MDSQVTRRGHGRRRAVPQLSFISVLLLALLALTLSACDVNGAGTITSNDNNPTATTGPSSDTPTSTPNTDPGTGTPVPTTGTGGPTPFAVNGITISVSPDAFSGSCSSTMVFTFTAHILVPAGTAGGTVKYRWFRNDGGSSSSDQSVVFAAGETSKTVTTTWSLGAMWGDGSTNWEQVKTSVPNVWSSPHANFHFICHFGVTGASLSVSPSSFNCALSSEMFTFSGSINVNPAPGTNSITYHWERTDSGHTADITVNVPAGGTSASIHTTWTLGSGAPAGDYGEKVVITKVNGVLLGSPITSNTPTFHKNACF
jgi:hypothetical protein